MSGNTELRRKWTSAIAWLNDELERRPYAPTTQYAYSNWSPPAQSNETTNGYYLERSHSAKMTLAKAFEFFPHEEVTEEVEEQEMAEESESPPLETISSEMYPNSINLFGKNKKMINKQFGKQGNNENQKYPLCSPPTFEKGSFDGKNRKKDYLFDSFTTPWINCVNQESSTVIKANWNTNNQWSSQVNQSVSRIKNDEDDEEESEKNCQQNN